MARKTILIFSHALELGGAEKALIGLLDTLDPERVDVDLFLMRHAGELMELVPSYVHLLPEMSAYTVLGRPMVETAKEGHLLLTASRFIGRNAARAYSKKHGLSDSNVPLEYSHKYTKWLMPRISPEKEYDLAISFLTPHYFVAEKVRAKKKIAWIHTDYAAVQVNEDSELKMWDAYDHIVSISETVTESFLKTFPTLKEKMCLIRNILPTHYVKKLAEEGNADEMNGSGFKLLSIGRFCYAKNFDNVPDIMRQLLSQGIDARWYLIGYGPDEELIRRKIKESGMENRVLILGKKENPYPYIRNCDLYIQPSRYEGNCVSVREAQMLAKPVIITRYATSAAQVEDGVDGVIVEKDNVGCAEGIVELLNEPEKMIKISENCMVRDYSNEKEIEKLYTILEENK